MDLTHVAVGMSWRVTELGYLVRMLQKMGGFKLHVFCNVMMRDRHLVDPIFDELGIVPTPVLDEPCSLVEGEQSWISQKRSQPLRLVTDVLQQMVVRSRSERFKTFIYTEPDVIPLDRRAYVAPLLRLTSRGCAVKMQQCEQKVKGPEGLVVPTPIYFGVKFAAAFSRCAQRQHDELINRGISFEGMLGSLMTCVGLECGMHAQTFSTDPGPNLASARNIEPVNLTCHVHSPSSWFGDVLNERGITGII
jgi:hypothetical protein